MAQPERVKVVVSLYPGRHVVVVATTACAAASALFLAASQPAKALVYSVWQPGEGVAVSPMATETEPLRKADMPKSELLLNVAKMNKRSE